jgi:hypothetical protein
MDLPRLLIVGNILLASAATAADKLPLPKGIYVREGVACRGASHADMLSYWGGDNGINDQQTSCTIARLVREGRTYTLTRSCKWHDEGKAYRDHAVVTITRAATFTFSIVELHPRPEPTPYRYCGARVQR